ncbi:MAG: hydrogenase 4 subunit F [Acidobacteria bacterium]|nr:hydrogenase 4 subunit F [Acidobacteriota bacterium]
MLTLLLLLGPPLVASCVSIVVRPYKRGVGWFGVGAGLVSLGAAVTLCANVLKDGSAAGDRLPDLWRVDALSALLAVCIAFVALLASALGPGLESRAAGAPEDDASQMRRFRIFMNAFAFTMLAAVTVQNVALMWVAIEATTIMSAMLIPLVRTKASVEASWKYLLICSVGIALAFAGTVLAYFDFVTTAGEVPDALTWLVLRGSAHALHPELLQLAFAFIVVGYGTKAGLAPKHTWLPDAHSEAPSPISAMMSGVLLAVAVYAIARWKAVIDAAVDPAFTNNVLIGFGLLSVAIGSFSLVIQRHYKRMLAYSSVEHMGLVSIGLALGPLGAFAAWLHVVNHAVAKSASFLLAGRVLRRYRTTEIDQVTGLLQVMPWTGTLLAAGILALVGLPPFGLFVSEFLLVRAAVLTGHMWVAGIVLFLLLMAFIALLGHLNRMLYGDAPSSVAVGERRGWAVALLAVPIALLVAFAALPAPLSTLIDQSVAILMP